MGDVCYVALDPLLTPRILCLRVLCVCMCVVSHFVSYKAVTRYALFLQRWLYSCEDVGG